MLRPLLALLAVATLCACTRVVVPPTATTVAYTGPRTHGYPTPDLVTVVRDSAEGVAVTARGDIQAVAAAYVAAWDADGWAVTPGAVGGNAATVGARRGAESRVLAFGVYPPDPAATLVWITPHE